MERTKENAYNHMIQVFAYSWTWERLTDTERETFRLASVRAHLRGNYEQRCEQMNDLYYAFLMGCGYSAIGWREEQEAAQ